MDKLDINSNISLEASAGTGKTFQLAMRAVALLLQNVPPKDILCLTFTNKATDEMLERILTILDKLAANIADDDYMLFNATLEPAIRNYAMRTKQEYTHDFISKIAKRTRDNLLAEFSNLKVKTNDAFFNNVLKMFPFEAELRPNFQIVTDDKIENIRNEAFFCLIEKLLKDKEWDNIFKNFAKANEIMTTNILDTLFNYSSFVSDRWLQLSNSINDLSLSKKNIQEVLKSQLEVHESALTTLQEFIETFDISELNKNQVKVYNKLKDILFIKKLYPETFFQKGLGEHSWFSKFNFSNLQYELFDKISSDIKSYLLLQSIVMRCLAYMLGRELYICEQKVKNEQNALTYSDIQTKVYEMLSGAKPKINSDYLYYRLDGKINHILLDEFQDTSDIQWNILKPLVIEAMAGIGQYDKAGSFFYVGDPKQNIYRFRGGSSALFSNVANSYKDKIKTSTLETNYRSDVEIVKFVNELFNKIANDFDRPELNIFKISQKARQSAGRGYVEVESSEDFEEYTVAKVKEIAEKGRSYSEIAVLVTSNSDGVAVKVALEKELIPVRLETSRKLVDSTPYVVLIALINLIYTDNEIFFTEYALTEPQIMAAAKYAKQESRIKYINALKNCAFEVENETILEKLIRLIKFTNMDIRFHNELDFIQTIDIIAENLPNEKNFMVFIEKLSELSGSVVSLSTADSNSVSVMTIHKSKGLQFPIVILPKLDIKLTTNSKFNPFIMIESEDIGSSQIEFIHSQAARAFLDDDEKKAIDIENALVLQDALNNLYVAATRAENALMINAKGRNDDKEPLNISQLISKYIFIESVSEYKLGELDGKQTKISKTLEHELHFKTPQFEPLTKVMLEQKPQEDYASAIFGTFLHETAFRLNGFKDEDIERAINMARVKLGASLEEKDIIMATNYLKILANNESFKLLFKGKVYRERRFSDGHKLIQIDLYSIFNDHIALIDYKTGLLTEDKLSDYKMQLFGYSSVLNKVYKLPVNKYLYNFYNNNLTITKY